MWLALKPSAQSFFKVSTRSSVQDILFLAPKTSLRARQSCLSGHANTAHEHERFAWALLETAEATRARHHATRAQHDATQRLMGTQSQVRRRDPTDMAPRSRWMKHQDDTPLKAPNNRGTGAQRLERKDKTNAGLENATKATIPGERVTGSGRHDMSACSRGNVLHLVFALQGQWRFFARARSRCDAKQQHPRFAACAGAQGLNHLQRWALSAIAPLTGGQLTRNK